MRHRRGERGGRPALHSTGSSIPAEELGPPRDSFVTATPGYIATDNREYAQEEVLGFLEVQGLRPSTRGSWRYGDFHLDKVGRSLSDLDLVVEGLSSRDLVTLRKSLIDRLPIRMNVSIHPQDSFPGLSLEDSRILNTCEYISKLRTRRSRNLSYFRAKILLLLLRESTVERYENVATRLGTPLSAHALRVKLGQSSTFTIDDSVALASKSSEQKVAEFIEQCVVQEPAVIYLATLVRDLESCSTIDSWLKQHLLDKMKVGE